MRPKVKSDRKYFFHFDKEAPEEKLLALLNQRYEYQLCTCCKS